MKLTDQKQLAKDREAIRKLKRWVYYGRSAVIPGGGFRSPIALLCAIQQILDIAEPIIKERVALLRKWKAKQ